MATTTEELNYVGTTKKQLWALLKEWEAEAKKKGNGTSTTTEVMQIQQAAEATDLAEKLDVDALEGAFGGVFTTLRQAKKQYDAIKLATEEAKKRLKDVHDLEATANKAVALAAVQDEIIENKKAEAREIIEEARANAKELMDDARETAERTEQEAAEQAVATEKEQARKAEEWEYSFSRKKKQALDQVNDQIAEQKKQMAEREEAMAKREKTAEEHEKDIARMQALLDAAAKETEIKVAAAIEETKLRGERSAKTQKSIIDAHHEGVVNSLKGANEALKERIADLQARLDKAEASVSEANGRVTTIATESMRARADAATVSKVAEVAAASGGKK